MTRFRFAAALAGTSLAILSSASSAQQDSRSAESGLYVGGAVGLSRDSGDYAGPGETLSRHDATGTGARAYVGFRAFRYFGIEIGYARIGATRVEGTDANGAAFQERFTHEAVPLSFVGFLPLGDRWELIGRLGLTINSSYETGQTCYYRTRNGPVRATRCTKTPVAYGLGVRYALDTHWGVRLDYDFYQLRDSVRSPASDLNLFSLGLDYRF